MSRKRKPHHDEHIDESWLIPYADLLTLLLALFIILFASSEMDSKKYNSLMQGLNSAFNGGPSLFDYPEVIQFPADPAFKLEDNRDEQEQQEQQKEAREQLQKETAELQRLKEQLDSYIAENKLGAQLDTKLNSDMLMITIRDNALFDSGSAAVKPDAGKLALTIADMLSSYPQYQIEVAGHTDNVPIRNAEFDNNWDLSTRRALNFMKILLQSNQIAAERFRAIGYSEYHPIDTNDTAEGRARNRRVEVSILRTITEPLTVDAAGNP